MRSTSLPMPVKIDPDGIYSDADLRILLGVTSSTLSKARREGSLSSSRKGKQTFYQGSAVIDWLFPRGEATPCS